MTGHPLNDLPKALRLGLFKTVYLLLDRTEDEWPKVSFSLLRPRGALSPEPTSAPTQDRPPERWMPPSASQWMASD